MNEMQKITTYEQFEAATEEEQAVWLGEKLGIIHSKFDLKNIDFFIWIHPVTHHEGYSSIREFTQWLHSLDGIDAIEREMIERGYDITIHGLRTTWEYEFKRFISSSRNWFSEKDKKSHAIIHAAAKALLGQNQ